MVPPSATILNLNLYSYGEPSITLTVSVGTKTFTQSIEIPGVRQFYKLKPCAPMVVSINSKLMIGHSATLVVNND